jgi:hypothetical protein
VPRSITGTQVRRRVRALALLTACAVAGATAGCSAGRTAQTTRMVPAVPGFNTDAPDGSVSLRDVMVVYKLGGYARGDTAPLSLHIVNNRDDQTITLRQVTANAGRVCLAGSSAVPTGTASTPPVVSSGSATPSATGAAPSTPTATRKPTATPTPTATPSTPGTTSPSATPSASSACNAEINVRVPPSGYATLSPDTGPYLAVTDLGGDLLPGAAVTLTFVFDNDRNRTIDGV